MSLAELDTTMVRRWKRYGEYRAVRAETLMELPTHWRTSRLKFVTRINPEVLDEGTHPDYELQYIDISNVDALGRIHEEQTFRFKDAPSRARRRVRHRDLIISTVRTYLRAVATIENPPDNLIVSTGFAALRSGKEYDPRFLSRLIQSNEFIDSVVNYSEGVGYPAINPTELGGLPVWVPPLPEQRAIAAFLDRETARIDTLIGHKERLIALLEEKRQAVISHAVTRGLDADAPLKDSGVPFWGKIPAHWIMMKLRHLVPDQRQIMYGIVLPGPHVEDGIPIVKGGNCEPGRLRLEHMSRTSRAIESGYERSRLQQGDIVYAIRGSIGAADMVPAELAGANLTQDAARIAIKRGVHSGWLLYTVRAMPFFAKLDAGALGATIRGINIRDLKRADLPRPPFKEQVKIAGFLDQQTRHFDSLAERITDGIARLQEYRTALISAAVTGQIDVRGEVTP